MNHTNRIAVALIACLVASGLAGCNDDDDDTPSSSTEAVTINFAGKVGDAVATCGTTYDNIGTTAAEFKLTDFRMYVSNLALKLADGSEIAIELDQDGTWQTDTVALLDFENGCENGSAETNTVVQGEVTLSSNQVPAGICFDIGVPFELNHADIASAPSPLNVTGLYWVWQYGHKFVGIDGVVNASTDASNYYVHLGSTGCTNAGDNPNAVPDAACDYPNRPRVCLDNFDAAENAIAIDLDALLIDADITANAGMDMGMSCMSFNDDINCASVLPKLGIDFVYDNGVDEPVTYPAATEQTVFSVVTQ